MWECGEGQTDGQRDTQTAVTNIHIASATHHAKGNYNRLNVKDDLSYAWS